MPVKKTTKEPKEEEEGFFQKFKKGGLFGLFSNLKEKKELKTQSDLIKKDEVAQKVLLHGITNEGFKDLEKKLPDLLKNIFNKEKTKNKEEKKSGSGGGLLDLLPPGILKLLGPALAIGGGIALLLGGLAALVTGLQTEGPFKGLLKIFSNVGIAGGLKLLEKGALGFIKNMKTLVAIPTKIFKVAAGALKGIFGKGILKSLSGGLKLTKGLLPKLLGGVVKFITPLLKKLPLIGTIISFAFAWSRFKSGDTVGGVIDILSGLAGLLTLTGVGAPVAIAISTGLDVLNAFLDAKAGGSSAEASKKKAGMIGDFFKGIGSWIYEKSKDLPVIGRLIKAGEAFSNKQWAKGLTQLSRLIPGTGWVTDFFGYTEEKQEQVIQGGLNISETLTSLIKEKIWDKVFGFAGRVWNKAKEWWNNTKNWWNEKTEVVSNFGAKIGSSIKGFAVNLKDKIQNKISNFASGVKDGVKNWWSNTKNWWNEIKEEVSDSYLGKQFSKLMSWMKNSVWDKVTGFASKTWEGIKGWWSKITDWWNNDKAEAPKDVEQNSSNVIGDLMAWMKTSVWGKVTGFFSKITDSIKNAISNYVDNLSLDPRSWVGMAPQQPQLDPNDIGLKDGALVKAKPGGTRAIIGEGGEDEAVIPLSEFKSSSGLFNDKNETTQTTVPLNPQNDNTDIFKSIQTNTGDTKDIMNLLRADIQKLTNILNHKDFSSNNIMVGNNQQQKQQHPTVSQIANSNVDPIRQIRAQFA